MEAPKFEFAHLGVNARSKEEAEKFLLFCENILNFKDKFEKPLSYFIADRKMELMKNDGRGTFGHIAIYTPDMDAGIKYLESMGYEMDYDDIRLDENGKIRLIYIKEEMNGFAIHLTSQK